MKRFISSIRDQIRLSDNSVSIAPKVLLASGETSARLPLKLPPNYAPNMMYPKNQPTPDELLLDQLPKSANLSNKSQLQNGATHLKSKPEEVPSPETVALNNKYKRTVNLTIAGPRDFNVIVNMMQQNYVHDEPLLRSLGVIPTDDNFLPDLWRKNLQEGMTIKALSGDDERRLLGVVMNVRNCSWDALTMIRNAEKTTSVQLKKWLHIKALVAREPKIHQKFSTHQVFDMATLYVDNSVQRQGLARKLIERSMMLGKDLGFEIGRLDVTNDYIGKIAERAGMHLIWEVPYSNLVDSNKEPITSPEYPHTHIKVYAINLRRLEFTNSSITNRDRYEF